MQTQAVTFTESIQIGCFVGNVIAMWAVQVAVAVCLLAPSTAYFFETGYTHHYTYWAENSLFDQHNVTTVLKVYKCKQQVGCQCCL